MLYNVQYITIIIYYEWKVLKNLVIRKAILLLYTSYIFYHCVEEH